MSILRKIQDLWSGERKKGPLAVVLSGGGARAAYQVGVLQYISEAFEDVDISILTGVSAGAINAAHLGNFDGSLEANGQHLAESWSKIQTENVFQEESGLSLIMSFLRGAAMGRQNGARDIRGLVDTDPLRQLLHEVLETEDGKLHGISRRVREGELKAAAMVTTNYATGQTVTFVHGDNISLWERATRVSVQTKLSVDHIMASTALPIIFPAIQLGEHWFGDGGIRLSAPLSPAIHLGADRMLVVSTRHRRTRAEADVPATVGYPPAAQIIGIMMNAVFLDVLDQDSSMVRRINNLVAELPERRRHGMRPIQIVDIRPSVDLGRLAHDFEQTVPGPFRFLTRGLGTNLTDSPDWLSLLLFEKEYIRELISIGRADARNQHDRLARLFEE